MYYDNHIALLHNYVTLDGQPGCAAAGVTVTISPCLWVKVDTIVPAALFI
jgi:hypothetical protein